MEEAGVTAADRPVIAAANEKGYLVTYNHPEWSRQDYPDYAPLKGIWGMELCNYSSSVSGYNDRDNAPK